MCKQIGNYFSVHCIASYPEPKSTALLQKVVLSFKVFRMWSLENDFGKMF